LELFLRACKIFLGEPGAAVGTFLKSPLGLPRGSRWTFFYERVRYSPINSVGLFRGARWIFSRASVKFSQGVSKKFQRAPQQKERNRQW
jgi:hypothetical protein